MLEVSIKLLIFGRFQLNYYDGEVWPCCVLGYSQPMGFLRESDYNFQKIWHSNKANEVRKYIKEENCVCPLANQAYSNILCHPISLGKLMKNIMNSYISH